MYRIADPTTRSSAIYPDSFGGLLDAWALVLRHGITSIDARRGRG
jgi:hypothetical protein